MSPRAVSFDPVARIYRWAEYLALGPLLQRTRTHFLPELDGCRNALVLGDGDGRFLEAFFRHHPTIRARAYDTSAEMLRLLSQRCAFARSRLHTEQRSLLLITPPPAVDLIVTHFVLDCFQQTDVNSLAHTLSKTKAGTLWLVSDFGEPRAALLRPFAALYIRSLYLSFAVLTGLSTRKLPNPQRALEQAGFTRLRRHERLDGFLYSELWQNNTSTAPDIHSERSVPEPAAPSLPEPNSGVYHHETGTPGMKEPKSL